MKRLLLIALVLVMAFSIMATAVSAQLDPGMIPGGTLLPAVQNPGSFSWGAMNFTAAP